MIFAIVLGVSESKVKSLPSSEAEGQKLKVKS